MNRVRWGDKVDVQIDGFSSINILASLAAANARVAQLDRDRTLEMVEQVEAGALEVALPAWLR